MQADSLPAELLGERLKEEEGVDGDIQLLHFGHFKLRVTSDFPGGSDGKASVYNAGDLGLIPGLGRHPGEGNGNPFQYYCLENPMDGGA